MIPREFPGRAPSARTEVLMSVILQLTKRERIRPPKWLPDNVMYETIMGSVAYAVSSDTSDMDVYGFCIPPKDLVFPHLVGEIPGFGRQIKRFEQYQEHHIHDPDAMAGKGREYDLTIFSIVKYFQLCMENNPNMIDSLFTDITCVLHATKIANMVRDQRQIFLHKGSWHTFKGYAYQQLHKMANKEPTGKRAELVAQYGYDVKFAYHVVRLISEVEQILTEGDLDLQRNREQLKSIRRGEWTEQQIRDWFSQRERDLSTLYNESKLPHSPDEARIKRLLLECLEEHYGSLKDSVIQPDAATQALREVQAVLDRYRGG